MGCAGEGDAVFAGGVCEARHGGGGDVDWGGEGVREEGGAEVGVRAVDEDAGAEEDGGVDCGVEMFGAEVVGGGVVVGPAFFAEFFCGCFFYFVEVEEVGYGDFDVLVCFRADLFGGFGWFGEGGGIDGSQST